MPLVTMYSTLSMLWTPPKTRDGHTLQFKQEVSRNKKTKPFNGTAHDD